MSEKRGVSLVTLIARHPVDLDTLVSPTALANITPFLLSTFLSYESTSLFGMLFAAIKKFWQPYSNIEVFSNMFRSCFTRDK